MNETDMLPMALAQLQDTRAQIFTARQELSSVLIDVKSQRDALNQVNREIERREAFRDGLPIPETPTVQSEANTLVESIISAPDSDIAPTEDTTIVTDTPTPNAK